MQDNTISIRPGSLSGSLTVPPSKSAMQRICAAIWVKGGSARISNPGDSADDRVMLELMKAAGCILHMDKQGNLLIQALKAARHQLEAARFGESGLAARMCIPILSLPGHAVRLSAEEGLTRRPMRFFEDVLPLLGVTVKLDDGHLPGTISGKLRPGNITVDGSVSSQFITGLLMAYAAAGARDVTITVNNPVSTPYIALTLSVMQEAGLKVPQQRSPNSYYFADADVLPETGKMIDFTVEGDWSAAAFWLVAGAIAGPLTLTGLDVFSAQADKAVLSALMDSGAIVSVEHNQISVSPAPLRAFQFNATDCPDLFPPLAVLACYASGTSVMEGIGRLRHKESNRAQTICEELGALGADISLQDDLMVIRGGTGLRGGDVSAHNDHRVAMMCAIAALRAEGPVTLAGADAVKKSYPRFFEDLLTVQAGDNIFTIS